VQNAVSEQHRELGYEAATARLGLATRRRHAHDDVAQQARVGADDSPLPLRKGKNVRRTILISIEPVQMPDLFVAREKDGQIGPRHPGGDEHGAGAPDDVGFRHAGMRAFFDGDANGHDERRYARPCAV
jgi:hypothetical protein